MSLIGVIRDAITGVAAKVNTTGQQEISLVDDRDNVIGVQHPLPTDGDSVYAKDIDLITSSIGTFSGAVTDFFDDPQTENSDSSATNPKTFTISFLRPSRAVLIGIASKTGDFSNVKITFKNISGTTVRLIDNSADSTKVMGKAYDFPLTLFQSITFEFLTADPVDLALITMQKIVTTSSLIYGFKADGTIGGVGISDNENLFVTDAENGLAIAKGIVTGSTFVHKFGDTPDFDTGDGEVVVWDGANDGASDLMTYTYSATADIDRIVSSSAADTQDIEIQGLDTNLDLVTQTVTLTGQTGATLSTSLKRVFRMKNVGSVDIAGRVYCYVNVTTTAGVPDTLTNIRAEIDDGNNQSLMAVYTIPNGKTGYMRSWFASTAGAKKVTNFVIRVKSRPLGQVFQIKHISAISDSASSSINHVYIEPEVFAAGTDIELTAEITEAAITAASVSAGFDLVLVDD